MGKHKKELRAEKAKVKLKKGAKLPKNLNETKTEFKVRKINFREQLKNGDNVEGQRNLKDILTKLKHPNSSMRTIALKHLREVNLSAPHSIQRILPEVLQGVASVSLDLDRDTRREALTTLGRMLAVMPADAVGPFFHILSSYLRCAMTHIEPTIQSDSLLLLDILLQHIPQLVASQCGSIFLYFLEMISRTRNEGSTGRTLTLNVGQKQLTVKWRFKVLQRLLLMFQALVQKKKVQSKNNVETNKEKQSNNIFVFNVSKPKYFSLKRKCLAGDYSDLFKGPSGNTTAASLMTDPADDALMLKSYIEHLMPLLLEIWLEVRPSRSSTSDAGNKAQILLSDDASVTLKAILDIIENLWTLVDVYEEQFKKQELSLWFREQYGDVFILNFLHNNAFPFEKGEEQAPPATIKKKPVASKKDTSSNCCYSQNIMISHLACRFFVDRRANADNQTICRLLKYLCTMMEGRIHTNLSPDEQKYLTHAVKGYLYSNAFIFLRTSRAEILQLLRSTLNVFFENPSFAPKILTALCNVVQEPPLVQLYGAEEFEKFLDYLPQALLGPTVTQSILLSMTQIAKQLNKRFLTSLAVCIENVIANLSKIQIVGAANSFEGRKLIMNLFYWVTDREDWVIEDLFRKIDETILDKRVANYFKYILKIKI